MVPPTISDRLRRFALVCTSLSGIMALMGLVGLYANVWGLATLGMAYVPIAPSTAILFILLSLSVIIHSLWPRISFTRWFAAVVDVIAVITGALLLAQYAYGFNLGIEDMLLTPRLNVHRTELYMAPITAFAFMLIGTARLMLDKYHESLPVRNIASALMLVPITIALVVMVGYGYGTPLLYGGNIQLPMALPAAIAFFLLGCGALASIGPDTWIATQFVGRSVSALLLRAFLPLTLAILIAHGWMNFYFASHYRANPALSTAIFAVFSLFLVAFIVASLAGRIGGQIDQKETERRRAESALRESEEKFRTLFESADDAILLMDHDHIRDCNGSTLAMFACSTKDEAIGQSILNFCPPRQPDGRDSYQETIRLINAAASGQPQSFEWQHMRCDGTLFDAEVSLHSIELHGRVMLQAIVRDITERKRAEEEKRAFYRDTILNATDGKLQIADEIDVEPYITMAQVNMDISSASEVGLVRGVAERFLDEHGLTEDRLNDFLIAISEATANLVKHAGQGRIYVGADGQSAWVVVSDRGPGIGSLILPRAVLRRGFSTKPSMGFGYSIMLQMADRIILKTDKAGTDVVLIKRLQEEAPSPLDSLPDTWEGISSW